MRRRCVFLLVMLVLLQALTLPALAADGDGGTVWDLLDGISGFFSGLFKAIGNAVKAVLDGLKSLFIPREGYFSAMLHRLRDKLGEKLGGFLSGLDYLRQRFADLRSYRDGSGLFRVEFPRGHLLAGRGVDLLNGFGGVLGMVRAAFSGFLMLWTAAYAYRKITALVST